MATANAAKTIQENPFNLPLEQVDPEIFGAIGKELGRQRHEIELIASENIVSRAVLEAQGSIMTNKYAEGYPGKRYYGGCQFVDIAESLAIERAKKLFDCGFANVQPNSGSQANQGVNQALLQPGDTILGMNLASGGHLTHGAAPNQSGKWFNAVQYGVRQQDNLIDYDQVEELAKEHKPKMIIAGGSAIPRVIDFARFREIADMVGAYLHVDMAHFAGLVAAGEHPSPFPYAHIATTTTPGGRQRDCSRRCTVWGARTTQVSTQARHATGGSPYQQALAGSSPLECTTRTGGGALAGGLPARAVEILFM